MHRFRYLIVYNTGDQLTGEMLASDIRSAAATVEVLFGDDGNWSVITVEPAR